MSISDRKAKEKEDLKALILQGARQLFLERGIEQTTIRNIADAIDYSVGTVYVYFKDKNAILHALHTQGFVQLGTNFKVLNSVADPMERLKAMGKVYIKFAQDNTEMYDLMFNLKAPIEYLQAMEEDNWNEGKATFDVLRTTVQQCIDKGHFKGHETEPLAFMIWSVVHGMCSLEIGDRTKKLCLQTPDTILEDGLNEFLKMLDKM